MFRPAQSIGVGPKMMISDIQDHDAYFLQEGHVFKENKLKMAKHSGSRRYQVAATDLSRKHTGINENTGFEYNCAPSKKRRAADNYVSAQEPLAIDFHLYNRTSPIAEDHMSHAYASVSINATGTQRQNQKPYAPAISSQQTTQAIVPKPPQKSTTSQGDYNIVVGEMIGSSHELYEVLSFLGRGTFGQVVKCRCQSSSRCVAIKILKNLPSYLRQGNVEIQILQTLSQEDTESFNIVRAIECFQHKNHMCFVFELLEQNLYEYLKSNKFRPLSLPEIRPIAQQVLTALSKLKSLGLIHADLKPENIMLVNSSGGSMRYRVKVIDFGSACHSSKAVQNTYLQSRYYRAPEILLGLPFNEAIDMWSLGCVLAELYLGWPLYPGSSEYDQMRYVVETQGIPPRDLLEVAGKCGTFFIRDSYTCNWRLKTQEEYALETGLQAKEARKYFFSSLNQICDVTRLPSTEDPDYDVERDDRHQFTGILTSMLKLRPSERIVPDSALKHSFITMSHLRKYPFSRRSRESVTLMYVCLDKSNRQRRFQNTNALQNINLLPQLDDSGSSDGQGPLTIHIPSVDSSGLQLPTSEHSFNGADVAAAFCAAAALSNTASHHTLAQIPATHEQLSTQGASNIILNGASQGYPPIAACFDQNQLGCIPNVNSNAMNPVVLPQPQGNRQPDSLLQVSHSFSLYDLVAAGGGALSLLNAAVAAPTNSELAQLGSASTHQFPFVPSTASSSSQASLSQFRQPLQLKYSRPDPALYLSVEAEQAARMLSNYLEREQESQQLKRKRANNPVRLTQDLISVNENPLCDTIQALVQRQQQYCHAGPSSAALTVDQPQYSHPRNLPEHSINLDQPTQVLQLSQNTFRSPGASGRVLQQHRPKQSRMHQLTRGDSLATAGPSHHHHHHQQQSVMVNPASVMVVNGIAPDSYVDVLNVSQSTTEATSSGSVVEIKTESDNSIITISSRDRSFASHQHSHISISSCDSGPMNLATNNISVGASFDAHQRRRNSDVGIHREPIDCSNENWLGSADCSASGDSFLIDQPVVTSTPARAGLPAHVPLSSVIGLDSSAGRHTNTSIASTALPDVMFSSVMTATVNSSDEQNRSILDGTNSPVLSVGSMKSDRRIPIGRVQPMIKQEDTSFVPCIVSTATQTRYYLPSPPPLTACTALMGGNQHARSSFRSDSSTDVSHLPPCLTRNVYHPTPVAGAPLYSENARVNAINGSTTNTTDSSSGSSSTAAVTYQHQQACAHTQHQQPEQQQATHSAHHLSAVHAAAAAYHNLMYYQLQQQQQQQTNAQRQMQQEQQQRREGLAQATHYGGNGRLHAHLNYSQLEQQHQQQQQRVAAAALSSSWPIDHHHPAAAVMDDNSASAAAAAAAVSYYAAAAAAAAAVVQRERNAAAVDELGLLLSQQHHHQQQHHQQQHLDLDVLAAAAQTHRHQHHHHQLSGVELLRQQQHQYHRR